MYFTITLIDTSKTVVIKDLDGSTLTTLSSGNLTYRMTEDIMHTAMPDIRKYAQAGYISSTPVYQTLGGLSLPVITEDVTSSLVTRTVTLSNTPYSADSITEVKIGQTAILRADLTISSDFTEITFAAGVDLTKTPIEVTYSYVDV